MGFVFTFEAEEALAEVAVRLGADQVTGWSGAEQPLADAASDIGVGRSGVTDTGEVTQIRNRILAGEDPLGDVFCRIRGPAQRRLAGQTFTPWPVVRSMVAWAARSLSPARVVDPGTGSARFLVTAGPRRAPAPPLGGGAGPPAALIGGAAP